MFKQFAATLNFGLHVLIVQSRASRRFFFKSFLHQGVFESKRFHVAQNETYLMAWLEFGKHFYNLHVFYRVSTEILNNFFYFK